MIVRMRSTTHLNFNALVTSLSFLDILTRKTQEFALYSEFALMQAKQRGTEDRSFILYTR